jgi:N6-L-threonylcarbamoyladenine synthase
MACILGIESTCDETAASIVIDGRNVLSNVVASQAEIHAKYRGVVPEIASRAHIENILPVLREALSQAGRTLDDLDAIAIAHRPGLIGSLLIGVTAAKTLAWTLGKPLIAIDHVHAHLYSVMLDRPELNIDFPAVGAVLSGGHTALYRMTRFTDVQLIGTTIDDAVGEAYDKVSAILGLGYPGGPILDRLAQGGDARSVDFPRTFLGRESLDFSLSGLKTAVLYHVRGHQGRERDASALNDQQRADVAAAFQSAVIDVILKKLQRAAQSIGARSILIGGGVSANQGLRSALATFPLPVHLPAPRFCTDNAAMTAGLAHLLFEQHQFAPLNLDAITYSALRPV